MNLVAPTITPRISSETRAGDLPEVLNIDRATQADARQIRCLGFFEDLSRLAGVLEEIEFGDVPAAPSTRSPASEQGLLFPSQNTAFEFLGDLSKFAVGWEEVESTGPPVAQPGSAAMDWQQISIPSEDAVPGAFENLAKVAALSDWGKNDVIPAAESSTFTGNELALSIPSGDAVLDAFEYVSKLADNPGEADGRAVPTAQSRTLAGEGQSLSFPSPNAVLPRSPASRFDYTEAARNSEPQVKPAQELGGGELPPNGPDIRPLVSPASTAGRADSAPSENPTLDTSFSTTTEPGSHLQSGPPSESDAGWAISKPPPNQTADGGGRPHSPVMQSQALRPLPVASINVPARHEAGAEPATQRWLGDGVVLADRPTSKAERRTHLSFAVKVSPESGPATSQLPQRHTIEHRTAVVGEKATMTGQNPLPLSAGDRSASPTSVMFGVTAARQAEGNSESDHSQRETVPPDQPRRGSVAPAMERVLQRGLVAGARLEEGDKTPPARANDGDRPEAEITSSIDRERGNTGAKGFTDHELGESASGKLTSATRTSLLATAMGGAKEYTAGRDGGPGPQGPAKPAVMPETLERSPLSASAAKQIDLKLSGSNNEEVSMRVVERAGKVHVAVRTPGADLASALRQNLDGLVSNFEKRGLQAETWKPIDGASRLGAEVLNSGAETLREGYQEEPGGNRHPEENQQRGGRQRPNWLEELEPEEQTSGDIDEEVAEWLRTWQV